MNNLTTIGFELREILKAVKANGPDDMGYCVSYGEYLLKCDHKWLRTRIANQLKLAKIASVADYVVQQLSWLLRAILCAFLGHALEDNSYAGPDSGNISLSCKRCGWSHTTILY